MPETRVLDEDLVRVYSADPEQSGAIWALYWGDEVTLLDPSEADNPEAREVKILLWDKPARIRKLGKRNGGYPPLRFRAKHLLEITCIDVQQGDATLIRTPDRKLLLIDGGEETFVARMLAAWFPNTTAEAPLTLDAVVITHGDADHYKGLVELDKARRDTRKSARIFTRMLRVYHNGLVKRANASGNNAFGPHNKLNGVEYATELLDDPRTASHPSESFATWGQALTSLLAGAESEGAGLPSLRRLEVGNDAAFDVFRPEVDIRVLAPITEAVSGSPALPYLGDPAHTINGHSIILRLQYGKLRCLLGGDINIEGSRRLLEHVGREQLQAEVFKVPHHGSHEFSADFLQAVSPVVSVVSSGDENKAKEYVHPRANLLAALGRASRGPEPLLFCTELAAFFQYRGKIHPEIHDTSASGEVTEKPEHQQIPAFYAFERKVFGRVRIRSDGERVFVAVESASDTVKEAYAFRVGDGGEITRETWVML